MSALLCPECMRAGSRALLRAIEVANGGATMAPTGPTFVTVRGLLAHAAAIGGSSVARLLSPERRRQVVDLRRAVTWIAREASSASYPQIARSIGRHDHSTTIHLRRTAEAKILRDPDFAWLVERVWAAAECRPFGPDGSAAYEPVRVFEGPRPKQPSIALRPDESGPGRPTVRTEPGEYVPRHALPPVLAVVDDDRGESAGEDEDLDMNRRTARASAALLAALRREHPERMVA